MNSLKLYKGRRPSILEKLLFLIGREWLIVNSCVTVYEAASYIITQLGLNGLHFPRVRTDIDENSKGHHNP